MIHDPDNRLNKPGESCGGTHWQHAVNYDYTHHLTRRGWAWEFLRRNKHYVVDWGVAQSEVTLLPGQVPINEHIERLLQRGAPFATWYVEVDQMRGLNDGAGFKKGDGLIHAVARLLERHYYGFAAPAGWN